MKTPRICAVITGDDIDSIHEAGTFADIFEVRIDMIGTGWRNIAMGLKKPWIATNRLKTEGGMWEGSEDTRRSELLEALKMGAAMVDVELASPDLEEIVPVIKKKAKCIISHHDMRRTPPEGELRRIIENELAVGADICKLVTTARKFDDNTRILDVINELQPAKIVAFAMGLRGQASRILCPLCGGAFTYASLIENGQSASGQMSLSQMKHIYGMILA